MRGLFLTLFLASLVGLGACVSPLSPAEEARLALAGQELHEVPRHDQGRGDNNQRRRTE